MRSLTKPAAFAALVVFMLALIPVIPAFAAVAVPAAGVPRLNTVQFVGANNGWAAGGFFDSGTDYGFIEHTTNGGKTWTRQVITSTRTHYITAISFTDSTTGYAVDDFSTDTVFKTADGGNTWTPLSVPSSLLDFGNTFDSVRFTDATHGYVSGQSGDKAPVVWSTANGGLTWTRVFKGPGYTDSDGNPLGDGRLEGVDGPDFQHVVAVGAEAYTASSLAYRFNGSTWTTDTVGGTALTAVSYPDATHALAVGPSGNTSIMSGTSWTAGTSGTFTDLTSASLVDGTHGWVAGLSGVILSFDGTAFSSQPSGVSADLFGVDFTNSTTGWAVGDGETMLWTTDGGATWHRPDTTPPTTTISGVPAGWTNASVGFKLSASDDMVGVAATYYRVNGAARQTYANTTVTVSAEGDNAIDYWSVDNWTNSETTHTAHARIDKTPPTTTDDHVSSYSGPSTIHLTPNDGSLSGVASTRWVLDNGATQSGVNVPISGTGSHTLQYASTDNAGNTESTETATFSITAPVVTDTTTPNTMIALPAGATNGWYKTNPTYTLTAADEATNTLSTYHRVNSASWQSASGAAPLTAQGNVTTEGTNTVSYYSVDQASNTENTKQATVKLDKSAPVSTLTMSGKQIKLGATDAYSGVDHITYRVDTGGATTYAGPITVADGPHTVHFYATDRAGNAESEKTQSVQVGVVYDPVEGGDRYATAVEAVKRAFPSGADTVIVAVGTNFPDALGGAALAGAYDAPLLLTKKDVLPQVVVDEITALHATKAIVLGSTDSVSAAVADTLAGLVGGNSHVERVAGANRYATAADIATQTANAVDPATHVRQDVFLAIGTNFPDALAASPAAFAKKWPILLTPGTALPQVTKDAMVALGVKRVHVLGSNAAVTDAALTGLPLVGGVKPTYDRWQGGGRYATAVDIANKSGLSFAGVAIATGQNYPDALAGGVMQGKLSGVLLLTPTASLSTDTAAALTAHKAEIGTVRYLGSISAVGPAVRTSVTNLLK